MAEILFTTGQASGFTHIKPQTMRRYIKDFGEFFSDGARIPKCGRRFTPQDMNRLRLIRHMFFERHKAEMVRTALLGKFENPNLETYDLEDVSRLVKESWEDIKAVSQAAKNAKTISIRAEESLMYQTKTLLGLWERIKKIEEKMYLMAAENAALRNPPKTEKPKKPKGFLSW